MPIPAGTEAAAAELATTLAPTEADRLMQAEALVREFCRWHIAPSRTETVTLRGSGVRVQPLRSLYVTDVASVTVDGVTQSTDDYEWSQAGVLTATSADWSGEVVVAFTHGYDTPPAAVTGIVQAVAQRAVDNPGSKPRAQAGPFADTNSQSGFNQAPALTLLDAEKEALSHYRLTSVK